MRARSAARAQRPRSAPALAVAAVAALALALPGTAAADKAGSVTASAGAVQATLGWQAADFGVKDPRLTIVRAGATLFDASPLADADVCSVGCLYSTSADAKPLHVADLGGDAEPEVVADSYTGGAHCCIVSDVLYFNGAGYTRAEHNWGSYGYGLKDLNGDGRLELNGYDAAFEDAFTSHAASFEPPLVLAFDPSAPGALRDVTRSYPAVIRKNVKEALHIVKVTRRQHAETLGGVATYVADLYLLGRGREARPYLARARKRGDLRTAFSKAPRSFEKKLLAFLHKHGYR
jgi:hypothetical protein